MRENNKMKISPVWKKAAACGLALAFLLTACGGMSKSDSSAGSQSYQAAGAMDAGSPSAMREESYASPDWEEAEDMVSDGDYAMEAPLASADNSESFPEEASDGSEATEQADLKSANRKIVYTGNITLQTLEYDKSAQSIHDRISRSGGFIENEDSSNSDPYWYYSDRTGSAANRTRRYLNITARIPAEKFDAFMKDLENDGQVTNTSISANNISVAYANHDASRKALEIERDRLLKMMDKAETVEDMIAVEERLTEVERELGSEKTTLSDMDRDVNFSTVYISLEEVFEYSEQVVEVTYGERLQRAFGRAIEGFVTFWQELILFVVETFPFLIMLVVIIVLIVRFVRRRRRRRLQRRAEMAAGNAGLSASADGGRSDDAGTGTAFGTGHASPLTEKEGKRGLFGRRRDREVMRKGNENEAEMPAEQPSGRDTEKHDPASPDAKD